MDLQGPVPGMPGAIIRRVAQLPAQLPDGRPAGHNAQAKPGHLLSVMPGVGTFLARDGTVIEFAQEDDADQGAIALLLNGTARGALIHQRGELPLHAATLQPPGGGPALAICGASGAGKSTLAAELSRRGWLLVADDTTRVTWDGAAPIAWPSRDTIKLWKDACEAAALDTGGLTRVMRNLDKYYVQVAACEQPVKLGAIVELAAPDAAQTLSAGDKLALISRHTYRPGQILPLGVQKEHVRIVARVAAACRMFRLPGERSLPVAVLADRAERAVAQ